MNEYKIKIGDEITEANNFFIDDPKIGQGYWVDENHYIVDSITTKYTIDGESSVVELRPETHHESMIGMLNMMYGNPDNGH